MLAQFRKSHLEGLDSAPASMAMWESIEHARNANSITPKLSIEYPKAFMFVARDGF